MTEGLGRGAPSGSVERRKAMGAKSKLCGTQMISCDCTDVYAEGNR